MNIIFLNMLEGNKYESLKSSEFPFYLLLSIKFKEINLPLWKVVSHNPYLTKYFNKKTESNLAKLSY